MPVKPNKRQKMNFNKERPNRRKIKPPATREEIQKAVQKYLDEGKNITRIEITSEVPISEIKFGHSDTADNYLIGQ